MAEVFHRYREPQPGSPEGTCGAVVGGIECGQPRGANMHEVPRRAAR